MPLALIVIIIVGSFLAANRLIEYQSGTAEKQQFVAPEQVLEATSPTNTPTPTPTIRYVPPKPTVDPDPIGTCVYQYLGAQQIRRSLCNTQFECQVGGNWYFYTSREKCKQDQVAYWIKELKPHSAPATDSYDELLERAKQDSERITQEANRSFKEYKERSNQILQNYIDRSEEIANRKLELPPINIEIPTPVPLKISEPTPDCALQATGFWLCTKK